MVDTSDQALSETAPSFSNEDLHVIVHRKPACRIELEVKVSAPLAQAAHKKAVKAVSKEVVLPGFRKGKSPEQMVLKKYPTEISKEWQQQLANDVFGEAKKLSRVPVLHKDTKITFNVKNFSLDGAECTFSFETEPHLPFIDPKQFQPQPVSRPEVSEQKIEETIRQAQLFFAEWIPIADRAVKEGDFLLLNVDIIEDHPHTKLFENTRFEVTLRSMSKWMHDLVLGKHAGSTIEGISTPDEHLSEEEKKNFPPKKVSLHILHIEEAIAPPIDDAFAHRLGVKNAEDLRTNITSLLNRLADEHVQEKLREQVGEFLLTHYSFDLPRSLIEKETHFRIKQLLSDESFQRYWDTLSTEDRKKLVESIYEQSEKAVRMFYLCRHILDRAKITISPSDLNKAMPTPLEVLLKPQADYFTHPQSEMQQAEAYSRILLEKAEDYVIANR